MKLRLWHRLFLAFAALAIGAVLAMFVIQQRNFRQDFLAYSDRLIVARLQSVAQKIGERYEQVGDWDFLVRRPQVFVDFLEGGDGRARGPRLRPGDRPGDRPPPDGPPRDGPPVDRPGPNGPPPPRFDNEPRKPFEKAPPEKKLDPLNYQSRVSLISADGHHIIGNPGVPRTDNAIPIRAGGGVVGHLHFAPATAAATELDSEFIAAQARHALIAAVLVLGAALGFAWALARWLRRPVDDLARGADRLAAGDFSLRIDDTRGDELGDLARDFNRLAETLSANQQARRRWGADIAHELRTPLAILRGEIQAMQDGVRPLDAKGLGSLQAECDRLARLVEDLYQLSLADAGALEYRFEPLDLAVLLNELVADHEGRLRQSGLELVLEPMPEKTLPIRGDERRLIQLFANLLVNTQRYTDAPGRVVIRVSRDSAKSGGWRIDVDDTPPGVAPDLLPRLFDRLFRAESSRNRAQGGAGLGLSICKSIVEAHGGRIDAAASPLGGLRISIHLPATQKAPR